MVRRDEVLLILGFFLMATGLTMLTYSVMGAFYETIGRILTIVGIISAGLGFFLFRTRSVRAKQA